MKRVWTKKDEIYNSQVSCVEFYLNEYEYWRWLNIDRKDIEDVENYFGVGRYMSDEYFTERRDRIARSNPNVEEKALAIMRQVVSIPPNEDGEVELFHISTAGYNRYISEIKSLFYQFCDLFL